MFAVIKTGGKQYKVSVGDVLKVENLDCKKGQTILFEEVLCISNKENITYGKPILNDASVSAIVLDQIKDKKVLIFKKRRRHNSRTLNGHRQMLTIVKVKDISISDKKKTENKLKNNKDINKSIKTKKSFDKKTIVKEK